MINYETILSLFDDKLTLLEYLTKIEKALKDSTLTDITVEQPSETTAIFTFVFENGDTITTPAVTLPRGLQGEKGDKGDKGNKGDKGDKGDNGVSVVSAHFNNQFHLILTLSNNTSIDAGKVKNCYIADVGVLTIGGETTSFSLSATDRANIADEDINVIIKFQSGTGGIIYYMTKKYITDTGTHYFNLQTVATNGSVIAYSANIDTTVASQTLISRTIKTTASAVDSGTATNGQVLTADGNGGASWEDAGGGAPIIITITGSSGYLSATNLTTIKNNDNVIISNTTSHKYYYKTLQDTNSAIRFSTIALGDQRVEEIYINWSSGAWSITTVKIPSAKYQHNIYLYANNKNVCSFSYISTTSTAPTTIDQVNAMLNTMSGNEYIPATGYIDGQGHIIAINNYSGHKTIYIDSTGTAKDNIAINTTNFSGVIAFSHRIC